MVGTCQDTDNSTIITYLASVIVIQKTRKRQCPDICHKGIMSVFLVGILVRLALFGNRLADKTSGYTELNDIV